MDGVMNGFSLHIEPPSYASKLHQQTSEQKAKVTNGRKTVRL